MAAIRVWDVDEPPPFGIIDFDPGTLGELIEAVVGSAEKIKAPAPNRAGVSEPFPFNVLGEAERDIQDGLASLFNASASSFGFIEDQNGFIVSESRKLDLASGCVPPLCKSDLASLR